MAATTDPTPATPATSAVVPTVLAVTGGRVAKDFRDAADVLRNRVEWFGKVLVAISTLGTGAVGLAKVGDLFPVPDGSVAWAWGAVLGLLAAALAAVGIAVRLMRVGEPVVVEVDVDTSSPGVTASDLAAIRRIFAAAAARFGFQSLAGVQERERSMRRAAIRADSDAERARRTALADELRSEIDIALARAEMAVVRRRATDAVGSFVAFLLHATVLGGLVLFAAGADAVASNRVVIGDTAKACGDARTAGATDQELADSGCEGAAEGDDETDAEPSVDEQRTAFLEELAGPLATCLTLVRDGDRPAEGQVDVAVTQAECARIAALVATFVEP